MMDMLAADIQPWMAPVLLPAGFLILIKGAGWLVGGSVAIAERLGVNPLVIGLTIVAMGTSSPEVAAAVTAAVQGRQNLAMGNVFGANIANLALIGGLTGLLRPIVIRGRTLRRELPVMMGVALLLWLLLRDGMMARVDAAVLLGLFLALLTLAVWAALREARRPSPPMANGDAGHTRQTPPTRMKPLAATALVVLGFAALALGANLTIRSAVMIGQGVGLSEAVIGLTVLAIGTTLPEMITCLTAAIRGHHDLGVGNLVGSCIFNSLVVLGVCGLTGPFQPEPRLMGVDYWIMLGVMLLFYPLALVGRRVGRLDGAVLLGSYVAYLTYLVAAQ